MVNEGGKVNSSYSRNLEVDSAGLVQQDTLLKY